MSTLWQNWARTQSIAAAGVAMPCCTEEVVAAVCRATRQDLRVKAVGSGHSFTGIAVTDGLRLHLDRLCALHDIDADTSLVTVGAGITLRRLNEVLWRHGLALTNLGDVDVQTLAGALSTGTHGTGARFGGLATQVRALEMVLADGSVVRCSAEEHSELFAAARVGLGALGVITAVTLQAEPAYALHASEGPDRLEAVLDRLETHVATHDHVEFYWFPHTDRVLTKTHDRVPLRDSDGAPKRLRRWIDDELLSNRVYEVVCRLGVAQPWVIPSMNRLSARALGAREYTDVSYRVLTTRRAVRFREMEYAVPRECVMTVLGELRGWLDTQDVRVGFPVEVRFAAADDIWLSTAYDRETAYVAVHEYYRTPDTPYFDAVEQIMTAVGGRPHWGKLHGLDSSALRTVYPRLDDFSVLRDRIDPARRFGNAYLRTVLG